MKLADIKWALGELVSATLHPDRCDCPRHGRLAYRPAQSRRPAQSGHDDGADSTATGRDAAEAAVNPSSGRRHSGIR